MSISTITHAFEQPIRRVCQTSSGGDYVAVFTLRLAPTLDDAAVRTIRLAEPYAPLPATAEGVDVLHITRTWQFLPGNVMRNQ